MISMISPRGMQTSEAQFFKLSNAISLEAMERAAQALADVIRADLPEGSRIYLACGTGGNGGDGLALARLLCDRYHTVVILPKSPKSPDAIQNLKRLRGVPILDAPPREDPDAWVDALFGTGLSREPAGAESMLINRMNESGAPIYSADIPSGLNGRTGHAYPACVRAHRTVTFQMMKWGHRLNDGIEASGRITVADVGLNPLFPDPTDLVKLIGPDDIPIMLPPRPRNCHKGTCGHLLIIAGSFGMAGAAMMCASAALRSGVGLVTIACPKSIVPILQTTVPQAMCVPLPEADGAIAQDALPVIQSSFAGKTAVVIGCGLTNRVSPEILRAVLTCGLPAVIDADALNILSANPDLQLLLSEDLHILTPHPGEAKRLISDLDASDPVGASRTLSDLGATVLYKGASCVVSLGSETIVSASGCEGMARGGSGDILSGILGALIADPKRHRLIETAALASEIHGLAGERAQDRYGARAMNARDILEFLPEAFSRG